MQSYTTISISPKTKAKIKHLKENSQTYDEYLNEMMGEVPEEKLDLEN